MQISFFGLSQHFVMFPRGIFVETPSSSEQIKRQTNHKEAVSDCRNTQRREDRIPCPSYDHQGRTLTAVNFPARAVTGDGSQDPSPAVLCRKGPLNSAQVCNIIKWDHNSGVLGNELHLLRVRFSNYIILDYFLVFSTLHKPEILNDSVFILGHNARVLKDLGSTHNSHHDNT